MTRLFLLLLTLLFSLSGPVMGANSGFRHFANAAKTTGQIGMAGDDVAIQFGKDANQVEHAFRHTDALGLDRGVVQSEVQAHLKTVASQITPGKPFNQVIEVGGQRMQYTAFKLQDGTINVGRIHGAP